MLKTVKVVKALLKAVSVSVVDKSCTMLVKNVHASILGIRAHSCPFRVIVLIVLTSVSCKLMEQLSVFRMVLVLIVVVRGMITMDISRLIVQVKRVWMSVALTVFVLWMRVHVNVRTLHGMYDHLNASLEYKFVYHRLAFLYRGRYDPDTGDNYGFSISYETCGKVSHMYQFTVFLKLLTNAYVFCFINIQVENYFSNRVTDLFYGKTLRVTYPHDSLDGYNLVSSSNVDGSTTYSGATDDLVKAIASEYNIALEVQEITEKSTSGVSLSNEIALIINMYF